MENQADLQLAVLGASAASISYLQLESTIDFRSTPTANLLEITDLDLRGSDVRFELGPQLTIDGTDVRVRRVADGNPIDGVVDPLTGVVEVVAPVEVAGSVCT